MGKFADKKKEIYESSLDKDGKVRRTCSKSQFNELATTLLNDPDYEEKTVRVQKGEKVEVVSHPVADLRKKMIGGIAKDAGLDAADASKLIENHQFDTLPLYPVFAAALEGYLEAGKTFAFIPREDMQGSIMIEDKPEDTKTYKVPGKEGVTTTSIYGAHRKYKVKSKCPAGKRTKIN